jgi:uncharacterized ubiquitin-like protein YukD
MPQSHLEIRIDLKKYESNKPSTDRVFDKAHEKRLIDQAWNSEVLDDRSRKTHQLKLSLGVVTASLLNLVARHGHTLALRYCEPTNRGVCHSKLGDVFSLTLRDRLSPHASPIAASLSPHRQVCYSLKSSQR